MFLVSIGYVFLFIFIYFIVFFFGGGGGGGGLVVKFGLPASMNIIPRGHCQKAVNALPLNYMAVKLAVKKKLGINTKSLISFS